MDIPNCAGGYSLTPIFYPQCPRHVMANIMKDEPPGGGGQGDTQTRRRWGHVSHDKLPNGALSLPYLPLSHGGCVGACLSPTTPGAFPVLRYRKGCWLCHCQRFRAAAKKRREMGTRMVCGWSASGRKVR